MLIYQFSTKEFFVEISKILPEWNIEIIPKDYIDSPDKYRNTKITIIAKHKQHSLIVKQKSISALDYNDVYSKPVRIEAPWHYSRIYSLISHAIFDNIMEDKKEREKLSDNLSSHFSELFSSRKYETN